jgi:putative chitinase
MTPEQLKTVMPAASRTGVYAPLITATMEEFEISTPRRQAAWLAQIAQESGQLLYTTELGKDSYFARYEGNADLGNSQPGDGLRFKGRGLIQITGRFNYAALSKAFDINLLTNPELLAEPELATRSAGWFWRSKDLNQLADTDRFGTLTKRINGGYTHIDERIKFWLTARRVLGL